MVGTRGRDAVYHGIAVGGSDTAALAKECGACDEQRGSGLEGADTQRVVQQIGALHEHEHWNLPGTRAKVCCLQTKSDLEAALGFEVALRQEQRQVQDAPVVIHLH